MDNAHENGIISAKEYQEEKEYLYSEDFIRDSVESCPELSSYGDKAWNAKLQGLYSIIFAFPAAIGTVSAFSMYFEDDGDDKKYRTIIDKAKEDFAEAKRLDREAKMQKEADNYSESIV